MTHGASQSRITNPLPGQRIDEQGSAEGPEPAPGCPVPFERLLSVAVLTPAQAVLVAVQLLDATHLGAADGEQAAPAVLGAVSFAPTGDVTVAPTGPDDGTCVTELLTQLFDNAQRLPAHAKQEQVRLLHLLAEAARDPQLQPEARARELEGALTDALGSRARQRLSGELAALVHAFDRMMSGVPHPANKLSVPPPVKPAAAASPAARRDPTRPPNRGRALIPPRKRGRRAALLALVAAAVLAVSGYVVAGGPVGGIVGSLGSSGSPTAPATSAPSHPAAKSAGRTRSQQAKGMFAIAPLHRGPVTSVAVQETGRCTPGALCPVKVTVHLRPSPTAQPVAWKVGAGRLCKRSITWSAPTSVTALPGWTTVYATSSVRVPRGRSLALVALTTAPAGARSRPMPLTGSLHC